MVKVGILGGGINGVACAVKIKEKHRDFEVVLISKEFSPNTTGDGSGGLWYPYLCGNTPAHLLTKWGIETYSFLHTLWLEGGYDIIAMPLYVLYREEPAAVCAEPKPWAELVFGYRDLDLPQLEYLSQLYSVEYAAGHSFTTFQVLPPKIISYLHNRFVSAGGRVVSHAVTSLQDPTLTAYDVIVNCTGLGARKVVPDKGVFPIRGQIFKAIAPWINATVIDENSCHYIIPNTEFCVLGGTHQENNYNLKEDKEDTKHILTGCRNMIPGLKHAQIVNTWVGLRPGRDAIRMEVESRNGQICIHNYGHGGSGLTLFWGCSTDVLKLLDQHLRNNGIIQSKL